MVIKSTIITLKLQLRNNNALRNIIYWYNFTVWTAVFWFILIFLFSLEMVTTYINENRLNHLLRNIKTIKTASQWDMWIILKGHDWWRFSINENCETILKCIVEVIFLKPYSITNDKSMFHHVQLFVISTSNHLFITTIIITGQNMFRMSPS